LVTPYENYKHDDFNCLSFCDSECCFFSAFYFTDK
jgi:hypothetical protein